MTSHSATRVADAVPDSWVHRLLPGRLWPYAQLARWERPIGWWLLLWPCWWSLALAVGAEGGLAATIFDGQSVFGSVVLFAALMLLFLLGAMAMRGAGCTYNDLVDTNLDAQVARTASRPIPSGRVSKRAARVFLVLQAVAGLLVLVALCLFFPTFNAFGFALALASLLVVAIYPFAKRVTDWPQFVLGLAFSWGALMGWAVVHGSVSAAAFAMYAASIAWTIGYDTIYAHQDREDDALVGVRSTARLFGERTKSALLALYSITLALLALSFWLAGAHWVAYAGLIVGGGHTAS